MDTEDGNWFESDSYWAATFPFMFPGRVSPPLPKIFPKIATLTGIAAGHVLDLAVARDVMRFHWRKPAIGDRGRSHSFFIADGARVGSKCPRKWNGFKRTCGLSFGRLPSTWCSTSSHPSAISRPNQESPRARNIFASLKPGGTLLFDLWASSCLQPALCRHGRSRERRMAVCECRNRSWTTGRGSKRNRSCSRRTVRRHSASGIGFTRVGEIRDLFTSVGFADISLYGSLDGTPYGPQAQRLVVVGRKPRPNLQRADSG